MPPVRYSHYDVVAAGKGWHTDPWTMRVEDGYFYGRGVSDNKGPKTTALGPASPRSFDVPCRSAAGTDLCSPEAASAQRFLRLLPGRL